MFPTIAMSQTSAHHSLNSPRKTSMSLMATHSQTHFHMPAYKDTETQTKHANGGFLYNQSPMWKNNQSVWAVTRGPAGFSIEG